MDVMPFILQNGNFKILVRTSCEQKKILDQKLKFVSGYPKPPSSPTPTQYFLNIVADFKGVWLYCFPIFSIKIKNVFIF